jgi:sec-independent protein translocase protein TatA
MGGLAPWHWVLIFVALVVIFGSKKLPDAARGLGKSMRIFKSELDGMRNDGKPAAPQPPAELSAPQSPAPQPTYAPPTDAAQQPQQH